MAHNIQIHHNRLKTPHQAQQNPIFTIDFAPKPCNNSLRWFFILEQAEWLKALVLKVLDEPTKPYNQGFRRCLTSAFCFMEGNSDGRRYQKSCHQISLKTEWQPLFGGQFVMATCIFQVMRTLFSGTGMPAAINLRPGSARLFGLPLNLSRIPDSLNVRKLRLRRLNTSSKLDSRVAEGVQRCQKIVESNCFSYNSAAINNRDFYLPQTCHFCFPVTFLPM